MNRFLWVLLALTAAAGLFRLFCGRLFHRRPMVETWDQRRIIPPNLLFLL